MRAGFGLSSPVLVLVCVDEACQEVYGFGSHLGLTLPRTADEESAVEGLSHVNLCTLLRFTRCFQDGRCPVRRLWSFTPHLRASTLAVTGTGLKVDHYSPSSGARVKTSLGL